MGYKLSVTETNNLLNQLKKEYKIYGPKKIMDNSEGYEELVIGYGEIEFLDDIVYKEKSKYPIKDIIDSVTKTLYYGSEGLNHKEKILVFARPCDINAQIRQDNIYLRNGLYEDKWYKEARERIKFICIECVDGFENCFCTTMGSNKIDQYSLAIRFGDNFNLFDVKDGSFRNYFKEFTNEEFHLKFIENNKTIVQKLKIDNANIFEKIKNNLLWEEYNKMCVDCGQCSVVCNGNSSFATIEMNTDNKISSEMKKVKIFYEKGSFYSAMGGYNFRKTPSEKIKKRILYKFYEYKEKFGTELCVGCGRCIDGCPQCISIITIINKLVEIINT